MPQELRVANPPDKPLMIFDGDCGFCRRWIDIWRRGAGDRIDFAPSQEPAVVNRFPEIEPAAFEQSVLLIETDGRVYTGANAVFRSVASDSKWQWLLWLYQRAPWFARVSETSYRLISENRQVFSVLTKLLLPAQPHRYALVRSIFIRFLGLVYLIAFASLWTQIIGLIGANGIVPVEQLMDAAREQLRGFSGFAQFPTLCWFSSSDLFLHIQCGAGTLLAVLLIAGFAPAPTLFLLWLVYLSLATASGVFLSFQWDNLLLETGLLAVLLAPLRWRLRTASEPSRIPLWLLRWLLFRLMFQSGCVKILSGDKAWLGLGALGFHYETQPLPTWVGWYVHNAPGWFHSTCTVLMFVIELAVPFFMFGPRNLRLLACWIFVPFQISIAITGNFGFFNLLAIVLCLSLLDDQALERIVRAKSSSVAPPALALGRWPGWISAPAALLIFVLSAVPFVNMLHQRFPWPDAIRKFATWETPFRSVNQYGLFAVMTVRRPEIVIEGTVDGQTWRAYQFKHKPGDLDKRPRFVAPHQPRLDWQMWFAALGTYQQNPWFANLCLRLLQGSPEVLSLFEDNPFPGRPPRYIRAVLYEYRFTDSTSARSRAKDWWRREQIGYYSPPLGLPEEQRRN